MELFNACRRNLGLQRTLPIVPRRGVGPLSRRTDRLPKWVVGGRITPWTRMDVTRITGPNPRPG